MRNGAWVSVATLLVALILVVIVLTQRTPQAGADPQEIAEAVAQAVAEAQKTQTQAIAEAVAAAVATAVPQPAETTAAATAAPASIPVATSALASMGDEELANMFFGMVNAKTYQFTWHYETEPPAGFYEGNPPHGGILRTYMNNIAYDAVERQLGTFPPGSIIVKENYDPGDFAVDRSDNDRAIPGFSGSPVAVTIMAKISGYNPEAGDWFWTKLQSDGTIDAAGKPAGCIGCHGTVANNDWVYDANVSGTLSRARNP